MAKLSVKNLNLWFGNNHVLRTINLEVPEREVVALIGPSGCGKSTLLRAMNRMHDLVPAAKIEGEVYLDDTNIYSTEANPIEVRRRIGMVFQRPNPFPKSIYNNVAYGLQLNGYSKNQIEAKVEESLKGSYLWNEVGERLSDSALSLSGGQQQRLCIARAIAVTPEVILMDEPCSALDPISTTKVEELITQLKEQFTIIIVTHNMQQAERVADKTAFMYLGEVIEYEPTEKLFRSPAQKLTDDYINGNFG